MISKKILKEYEFNNIDDYFVYIYQSQINGQTSQCTSLIKQLSQSQKRQFLKFLEHVPGLNSDISFLKDKTFQLY